ncbi:MAG: hypothetical protein AAGD47_10010, partial [Pseudomonadota bacterium]
LLRPSYRAPPPPPWSTVYSTQTVISRTFYLLDEPTNHLDIDGQEALEGELITHDVSCLLVSHDRSFLRNVANRFWLITGKGLEETDSPEPFLASEMSAS